MDLMIMILWIRRVERAGVYIFIKYVAYWDFGMCDHNLLDDIKRN
ncbi:hypothetical protein [Paenibacillus montaniterrae]|nr:hypothetical protein [Paenibacillus montaniterrae]